MMRWKKEVLCVLCVCAACALSGCGNRNDQKSNNLNQFIQGTDHLRLFTGLVNKAFGSLTYDKEMSKYKEEYIRYIRY